MKKHKILVVCLFVLAICSIAIGFTSCDKHEHVYTQHKTDATCTEKGVVWYECECGDSYLGTEEPALGHSYVNYVYNNDATCMSDGTETAVCERDGCEETDTRRVFDTALGHSYGDYVYNNDATCTSDGTQTAFCEHEGCELSTTTRAWNTQLEHTYDQEVVADEYLKAEATCYEAATYYKSCTCGKKSETETFTYGNLAEHPMASRWSYDATYHWYSSTCSHEIQADKAEHTVDASGFCSVCGKPMTPTEGVVYTTVTVNYAGSGTERWAEVTGYTGSATRVIIADTYNSVPVRYIRSQSFTNSSVTDVVIPDNVYYINENAFGNSLENVTLGAGVKTIGKNAFKSSSLKNVFIGNLASWCAMAGEGVTAFEGANLYYRNQLITDLVIPETVTAIRERAFYQCASLTSVTINGGSIGKYAFYGCDTLKNVTLGNNVTSIGELAFYGCKKLESATIGGGEIGESAFYGCEYLKNVTFGENVTSIGKSAFAISSYGGGYCREIVLPDSITTIGDSAFAGRGIESVTIGSGVTSIGASAFKREYLTNITVSEENVVYKLDNAGLCTKDGTTLVLYVDSEENRSVELPDGLTTIMDNAFYHSNVTNVVLPESVTSIGGSAFWNCYDLTSINIPDGITFIGDYAFGDCDNLVYTTVDGLYYLGNETNPHVYLAKIDSTVTKANVAQGCKAIAAGIFQDKKLTEVSIPDSVVAVGKKAFDFCSNLTSVTINGGSIGEAAFRWCSNLTSVTINGGSIGSNAFASCENLKNVTLGDNVTSIGYNAFGNCENLESVTINGGSIGMYAFDGCSNLKSVTLGDNVTTIGGSAFSNCSNLMSITLGEKITSIGNDAFYNCTNLVEVVNHSGLKLDEDYKKYGGITQYAISIHNGESTLEQVGDAFFITATDNTHYLVNMFVDGEEMRLPDYEKGKYIISISMTYYDIKSVYMSGSVCGVNAFRLEALENIYITDMQAWCEMPSLYQLTYHRCKLYWNNEEITDLVIPEGVTSIGIYAFYGCDSITSVTIPDSVKSIGAYAFCNANVLLPKSVSSVDRNCFEDCYVYYCGTNEEFDLSGDLGAKQVYYYSETEQKDCWHYVDGVPTAW